MPTFPSPLIFTQRSPTSHAPQLVLALTADERTKSRHYFQAQVQTHHSSTNVNRQFLSQTDSPPQSPYPEQGIYLQLPRGTVLQHDDYLTTATQDVVLKVIAKPEPVMTVTTPHPLSLLKAAYHLGNRHVSLEVNTTHLRLSPDPVLRRMLEQMGLTVTSELVPFHPETGAYGQPVSHNHGPVDASADHTHSATSTSHHHD